MPSVPGQPILDLRLLVQLVKTTASISTKEAAKNIFFI
jgi:hypothetical protein